ncbi:hypothetical protein ACFW6V_26320 [Streptomyces sp. NPDC058734]|uniref:hypothetical protein n=1 Tax=Streptomyces sp. NPDC058734 TaxID=3346615 RepID=UPI0036CF574E
MTTDLCQDTTPASAHWLQRSLAVSGALIAVLVTVWGVGLGLAGLYVPLCLGAVAPLLFLRAPAKRFGAVCTAAGFGLLGLGLLTFLAGTVVFWPSALLLLFAAPADPRRRPVAARVIGGLAAAVTTASLAGCGAYAWHFHIAPALAEPHTYRAEVDPGWFQDRRGLGDADERLKRVGATRVTGAQSDKGSYLDVRFADRLSAPERETLRSEIARMPGINRVALCPVSDCG